MPLDEGVSARDSARLRAARRRAGLLKASKPKPRAPVRGESAADKARVAPQTRARQNFEKLQHGNLPPAEFAKRIAGLTMPEKRDLERYSAVRSERVQDEQFGKLKGDTARFVDKAAGTAASFGLSRQGLSRDVDDFIASARGAKETLMDPGASRREKIEAAGNIGMVAGLGGGVGRGGKPAAVASPPPAVAKDLLESLPEARRLRREQEKGYSAERSKRVAKAEQAMQVGGEAGYRAALAELKGELPKLKFGALEQFDQAAADTLFTHVQQHAAFRPFEKVNTQTALTKVFAGAVPTKSEIKLLERAFGPDVAAQITESIPFWRKAKTAGLDIINVPRAIKSSFDLSAPFRQGLVLGARHPRMFARELKPMIKAMKSPGAYDDIMDEIASRPTFKTMQDAKLQLTDLQGLTTREEGFMSNFAEKIPGVGIGVRGSSRAYVAFLNKFRADAFDNYLKMAELQGRDITDPQLLKSISSWVNTATGRGNVKSLERAMVPLNALLFSPRLIASRLQILNPGYYISLDPFARKQAVQGVGQLLGAVGLTLGIAKMAGAEVGDDPRSSDFGKIKVGDTRIDITGGHAGYLVAAARIYKKETVSSTTGVMTRLEGGFAKPSRADISWNFLANKASPVAGYGLGWLKNENFAGDKFDPVKELGRLHLPIGVESGYEGFKESPGAGAATVGLGGIGFGVQTYDQDPVKTKEAKRKAALAERGPFHVREHEDRMTKLKAAAKAAGLPTSDPDVRTAVVSSRRIRDLDMQLRRAEKKKGTTLTYEERAKLVGKMALRVFPEYRAEIQAELASKDWERVYKMLRHEIRSPYESAVGG